MDDLWQWAYHRRHIQAECAYRGLLSLAGSCGCGAEHKAHRGRCQVESLRPLATGAAYDRLP